MRNAIKEAMRRLAVRSHFGGKWFSHRETTRPHFSGSGSYWEERYSSGGNSGRGSYGELAEFKAAVINQFLAGHRLGSVIEFGCGDGNQLSLAKYPTYLGFDVSPAAVTQCRGRFTKDTTKQFRLLRDYHGEKADLTLSLDVIFHLVEDDVFADHMTKLFESSNRYVIIYASNTNASPQCTAPHVRHRRFTTWIQRNMPQWRLIRQIPNKYPSHGDSTQGSFAEFFIFTRTQPSEMPRPSCVLEE